MPAVKAAAPAPKVNAEPARQIVLPHDHSRRVDIPRGHCPSKLNSPAPDDLEVWAYSVIAKGREVGETYNFNTLRYWLREFIDIHSKAYREAVSNLQEILPQAA